MHPHAKTFQILASLVLETQTVCGCIIILQSKLRASVKNSGSHLYFYIRGETSAQRTYFHKNLPHIFGACLYLRHSQSWWLCRQQNHGKIRGKTILLLIIIQVYRVMLSTVVFWQHTAMTFLGNKWNNRNRWRSSQTSKMAVPCALITSCSDYSPQNIVKRKWLSKVRMY